MNKSTTNDIATVTQECYSAPNSKEHLISVFLDFRKAFDIKCYNIIMKKLGMIEMKSKLFSLLNSYLSNR